MLEKHGHEDGEGRTASSTEGCAGQQDGDRHRLNVGQVGHEHAEYGHHGDEGQQEHAVVTRQPLVAEQQERRSPEQHHVERQRRSGAEHRAVDPDAGEHALGDGPGSFKVHSRQAPNENRGGGKRVRVSADHRPNAVHFVDPTVGGGSVDSGDPHPEGMFLQGHGEAE